MIWLLLSIPLAGAAAPFMGWPLDTNEGRSSINHAWLYSGHTSTPASGCHKSLDLYGNWDAASVVATHDGTVVDVLLYEDNFTYELDTDGQFAEAADGGKVLQDSGYVKPPDRSGNAYGNYVIIEHAESGLRTYYAHLRTGSILVAKGDVVKAGQPVGRIGLTGNTTGAHLHLQVKDVAGNSVDPFAVYGVGSDLYVGGSDPMAQIGPRENPYSADCPSADSEGYLFLANPPQALSSGLSGEIHALDIDGLKLSAEVEVHAEDGLDLATLTIGDDPVYTWEGLSGQDDTLDFSDLDLSTLILQGNYTVGLWVRDETGAAQAVDAWTDQTFDAGLGGSILAVDVSGGVLTVDAEVWADRGLAATNITGTGFSSDTFDLSDEDTGPVSVHFEVAPEITGGETFALWVRDVDGNANPVRFYPYAIPVEGTGLSGEVNLSEADAVFTAGEIADFAGESLASAGDVNGDGWGDILIGASNANNEDIGASGAVYLLFGPLSGVVRLDNANAVLYGQQEGDGAGASVASAGDLNGDGYSDILVGLDRSTGGGEDAGAMTLLLGPVTGSRALGESDGVFRGGAGDGVGRSVIAGDLDGDGLSDLITSGDLFHDTDGDLVGVTYLLYGAGTGITELDAQPGVVAWWGEAASDDASRSAVLGDVDGDGLDDLIVGAPNGGREGVADLGRAYILYGPASRGGSLSGADAILEGENSQSYLGFAVAGPGDVDGDGLADVLVGAPGLDVDARDSGAAYLWYSTPAGGIDAAEADVRLSAGGEDVLTGKSVSGVGDVDADGNPDFAVGAWFTTVGEPSGPGAVFLLMHAPESGVLDLSKEADAILWGETAGDEAGRVAGAGDVDVDGHDDLLVGAVTRVTDQGTTGQVYLLLGGP